MPKKKPGKRSDKPSYLGLLNAITLAESEAHEYLLAWAATTPSDDVRQVLLKVAAREGEHGMSFAKRIDELGYHVRPKEGASSERALALVTSNRSDLEKMKTLGLHRLDTGAEPDLFDRIFEDHSIDIATGELLGRYIAEERDSARLLRSCYEQLGGSASTEPDSAPDASSARLESKVDALCRAVDELRQIVCAQAMPAGAP